MLTEGLEGGGIPGGDTRVCGGIAIALLFTHLPFVKVQWRNFPEPLNQAGKDRFLQNCWFVFMLWAQRISWRIMFLFGFGY